MALRRQAFISLAYSMSARGALLAINFVALAVLSSAEFSRFAYISVLISGVAAMASLGISTSCNTVAAREYSDDPDRVSAVYTLAYALNGILAIAAAMALILPVAEDALREGVAGTVAFVVAMSLLVLWAGAAEGVLFGLGRQGSMLRYSLAAMTLSLVATAAFGWALGIMGALAGLAVQRAVLFAFSARAVQKSTSVRVSVRALRRHLSFAGLTLREIGIPLAIAGAMSGPLAALLLGLAYQHHSTAEVAAIAVAYQLFVAIVFIPNAFGNFLIARASRPVGSQGAAILEAVPWASSYALFALALMAALPTVIALLNQDVQLDIVIALQFGAAAAIYTFSSLINAFWIASRNGKLVAVSQLGFAAGMLLAAIPATGVSIGLGFLIGALAQLAIGLLSLGARHMVGEVSA